MRSKLAGLIKFHHAKMERVAADLKHLDATLKLFAPGLDLRRLGTKRVSKASVTAESQKRLLKHLHIDRSAADMDIRGCAIGIPILKNLTSHRPATLRALELL